MGGSEHDLADPHIKEAIVRRIREGEFDAIHVATPCSSFSINHDEALRTLPSPEGVKPMIPGYEDYITHHNVLAGGTAQIIEAAATSATPLSIENPAKRGNPLSPAYWPEFGDRAMLWDLPCIITALAQHERTEHFTFAMCAFGAAAQKWSTVVGVGHLATELQGLDTFLVRPRSIYVYT